MSNSRNLADLDIGAGGLLPSASMAAGAAVSNIGYTPVDIAGATMTGALTATGFTGPLTGNAATATNVAYSGLTGTVPTWNQDTTGNAATATTAATATNVAYSGLTGTVPTWNQSTTGNAATATNVAYSGLTGTVPTWNQSTTGNAATATKLQSTNWSVEEVSAVLYFKYGGVSKFKIDSSGNLTVVGNVTAYGTV